MSTTPNIDYDALAQKHGAKAAVDYDALAQKYQAPTPPPPENQISAVHPPTTLGGKVENFFSGLGNDLRYGTTNTPVGSFLKMIGAQPTTAGTSEGTGEILASPILGPTKMGQGAGQVMQPGKRLQGAKNIAGGALQTAQLPASFVAPDVAEAAPAVLSKAGEVAHEAPMVGRLFASTARAGKNFQQVNQIAGKAPFEVTPELSDAAMAVYKESSLGGGNIPQVVRKFVQRVTSPGNEPLNFEDARRFASNASGMTAGEWFNMLKNGNMRRLLGSFHGELNDAVQQAADKAGVGDQFYRAMNEYRQAKQNQTAASALIGTGLIGGAIQKGKKYLGDLGAIFGQ